MTGINTGLGVLATGNDAPAGANLRASGVTCTGDWACTGVNIVAMIDAFDDRTVAGLFVCTTFCSGLSSCGVR